MERSAPVNTTPTAWWRGGSRRYGKKFRPGSTDRRGGGWRTGGATARSHVVHAAAGERSGPPGVGARHSGHGAAAIQREERFRAVRGEVSTARRCEAYGKHSEARGL